MERLSPSALWILDHLRRDRRAFEDAYDVEALFHQWNNYVERVSFFNRYPDMTDHGKAHANNVVSLVSQVAQVPVSLTAPGQKKGSSATGEGLLNRSEILCLTAAAWLHDIGMFTTGESDIYDAMSVRKNHCVLSRDKMREERDLIFPNVPEPDVWIISSIAAYHQSRTALDIGHREALVKQNAELIPGMPTLEEELNTRGWGDGIAALTRLAAATSSAGSKSRQGEPIRVKLLAALLRVLDQCDIQMNRAGNLDFLLRRVDRSQQHYTFYRQLLEAIPPEASTPLRHRVEQEMKFYRDTMPFYLGNFFVEKTFIVGRRIYVKLNDVQGIRKQLALTPKSLAGARELLQARMGDLSTYYDEARSYIEKELALMRPYLDDAGFSLDVSDYPSSEKARREVQIDVRRSSPYSDATPDRPADWVDLKTPTDVAKLLYPHSGVRVLVIYSPPGRGRKQFVRSVAESVLRGCGQGDLTGLWWHQIERGEQGHDAVYGAASYLASHADYALANVFEGERLVTEEHVDFCVDVLARAQYPHVIVLQDFNLVERRYRFIFARLIQMLTDKVVICTTTRWPSQEAAATFFGDQSNQVRFLECPRLHSAMGAKTFMKVAADNRSGSDTSSERVSAAQWAEMWEQWGREAIFLDALNRNAWVGRSGAVHLPALVNAAMRSHFVSIWDRLGDRRVSEEVLRLVAKSDTDGCSEAAGLGGPDVRSALLELVDRGLVRWETVPGQDPWAGEDAIVLRATRTETGRAAWIHPGFRTLFAAAK